MDRTIDCGVCKRRVRGPWPKHASTDSHARATRGITVRHASAASIRRQNAGVRRDATRGRWDAWSDDGRDWDEEERNAAR